MKNEGICLEKLNVTADDSRDEAKMERFIPYRLDEMLFDPSQYNPHIKEWAFYLPKEVNFVCLMFLDFNKKKALSYKLTFFTLHLHPAI